MVAIIRREKRGISFIVGIEPDTGFNSCAGRLQRKDRDEVLMKKHCLFPIVLILHIS